MLVASSSSYTYYSRCSSFVKEVYKCTPPSLSLSLSIRASHHPRNKSARFSISQREGEPSQQLPMSQLLPLPTPPPRGVVVSLVLGVGCRKRRFNSTVPSRVLSCQLNAVRFAGVVSTVLTIQKIIKISISQRTDQKLNVGQSW